MKIHQTPRKLPTQSTGEKKKETNKTLRQMELDKEQPLWAWTHDTWNFPSTFPDSITVACTNQIFRHPIVFLADADQESNGNAGQPYFFPEEECKIRDMKMMSKNLIDMGQRPEALASKHISSQYWYNRRKNFELKKDTCVCVNYKDLLPSIKRKITHN